MRETWVEAIRVRSSAAAIEKALSIFKEEIRKINDLTNVEKAFVMQHALYPGKSPVFIIQKILGSKMKTSVS